MHIARHFCSPEPSDEPGELTHFLKHLSVTFYKRENNSDHNHVTNQECYLLYIFAKVEHVV